ncbi:MAG: hypothetical protein ACXW2E_02120 [Nitrososphaeraceae archaeon]
MTIKSNKAQEGRFVQGGTVEDFGNRLGWWERKIFPKSPTDVEIMLISKYNRRPDLLAHDLYGKSSLQWFILQYNNISDITEFEHGLTLILPTRSRLFGELLSKSF